MSLAQEWHRDYLRTNICMVFRLFAGNRRDAEAFQADMAAVSDRKSNLSRKVRMVGVGILQNLIFDLRPDPVSAGGYADSDRLVRSPFKGFFG